jgi:hypothetical protein
MQHTKIKHSIELKYYSLGGSSTRMRQLDAIFRINVCSGFTFCPSLLETVGIRVPTRNFRDFSLFTV